MVPASLPNARIGEETACRLLDAEEEIRSLCGEVLERYEETTLVYRLVNKLGSVLGEEAIAGTVLEDAARVLGADSAEIWLQGEDHLELVAAVPSFPARPVVERPGPCKAVLEGRPWIQESAEGMAPEIAVPIPGSTGEPIGAMVLIGRADKRNYRTGEMKLLTALATMLSAFIRNHRLAAKARLADSRAREQEIARQVYLGLLPERDPEFEGLAISGACISADTVGGDYYGYHPLPDGGLGVAMADVTGHGIGAAMYMAAAKGVFQAESRRVISPSDLLRRANEALESDFSRSDMFATAFFAHFKPGSDRFEYALGGHNPPILIRTSGRVEMLDRGGIALGILPDVQYEETSCRVEAGDTLVVYTDGLPEARDEDRTFYGLDRLKRLSVLHRTADADELRDRILDDLMAHTGGRSPSDDVTLIVIRFTGGPAPKGGTDA